MYVPKIPKRFDFCGCPPCGLCFDWVEPAPPKIVEEDKPIEAPLENRVDVIQKMVVALVGPDFTPEQYDQVRRGAENIHIYNLNKNKPTELEENKTIIDEEYTRREVNQFLDQKTREKANPKKELNTVNLDSIADKAAAEGKDLEKEIKVKEKTKNNVPIPSAQAPVDYDLLQREAQNPYKKVKGNPDAREEIRRRYREKMERERQKWMESIYKLKFD